MAVLQLFFRVVIVFTIAINANNYKEGRPSNRQSEVLESNGRVVVEWEVDFVDKTILFDVTAKTTGFVGFGLSPGGGMSGSDIIIGGISSNGGSYFSDYHGTGNTVPSLDNSQDWRLLSAYENSTHTFLRFSRKLETCDPQDVGITNDTLNILWALGATDVISYHSSERGQLSVNLLDPPQPAVNITAFKSWTMTVDQVIPNDKTYAYWCTIYKGPDFGGKKNHVVGFRPIINGALAKKHTHHFVVYRCRNPAGYDPSKVFGPFAFPASGDNCYSEEAVATSPSRLCSTVIYVWGTGGKEMFLPEHVGYSVGDQPNEYYMLEIHYDNPKQVHAKFESGVEIFYTDKLRKYDAGMMTIGHTVVASLMIPPKTKDFKIVGHCSGHCTNSALPRQGMTIFNVLMHTHLQGRRMRLRQFRNGTELPWVSNDDHYHFNYQKNRPLLEERVVLPGDSLTFECRYDTSTRDKLTTAGYSTRNEMCESFIWYYPKLSFDSCSSFYPIEKLYESFGIKEVEWRLGLESGSEPFITSPPVMASKTFSEAIDTTVDWTTELVEELQQRLTKNDHVAVCSRKVRVDGKKPPLRQHGHLPERKGSFHSSNAHRSDRKNGTSVNVRGIRRVNYPETEMEYAPRQTCRND